MLERLALLLLAALIVWVAARLAGRAWLAARARRAPGLEAFQPGRPAIVLFSAPGCAPCETQQRPALRALLERHPGAFQSLEIDALQRPDLADAWGVLSLPTTFVIDRRGRPRGVNHGVARRERLEAQLAALGELPTGAARPRIAAPDRSHLD